MNSCKRLTQTYLVPFFCVLLMFISFGPASLSCLAMDENDKATLSSAIHGDGTSSIIVEAKGHFPEPPVFFAARALATVKVYSDRIEQAIDLSSRVIQGKADVLSFGLGGEGEVIAVEGKTIKSWSVRTEGDKRYLDLEVANGVTELRAKISINTANLKLPRTVELPSLSEGDTVGFDSVVSINAVPNVDLIVEDPKGFIPLESDEPTVRLQTSSGGRILLSIRRDDAAAGPVELVDTKLSGKLDHSKQSMQFQLRGKAIVNEPSAEITILSGDAAVSRVPNHPNCRLRLVTVKGQQVYKLSFAETGEFPVSLDFVVSLSSPSANTRSMDFTIPVSGVVPVELNGLAAELEFQRDHQSIVPKIRDEVWVGFLPANGHAKMKWKTATKTGAGKLFFTTTAHVEAKVGTALLRQDHRINYQVLQGELKTLNLRLDGPGEVQDVTGEHIIGWNVSKQGDNRYLDVTLSQPIKSTSQLNIRSQTTLGTFPARVEGLRLTPSDAIRHAGYLRLSNAGLVRLEPTALVGLSQLSPEKFPGETIDARQTFVYRFPSAAYAFTVITDRIAPEVSVSEQIVYQVTETDRVINADIELDIRQAPIREWDVMVPTDYSVVSVSGASVADYIVASEASDGKRNLKIVFSSDMSGRQLIMLHLEKSQQATSSDWKLPRIDYVDAKSVQGNIGVTGDAGIRIGVKSTGFLVEKPLSYFPKRLPNLQQSFRIRQRDWEATVQIELLDRNIQSDLFHLYSLSDETVYGSVLINYFVTGSPVSEWRINVPENLNNVTVDGQAIRTWRREGNTLVVTLHQGVMGAYTLLITFEEKPDSNKSAVQVGQVATEGVQGERGYIQVVSPMQVEIETVSISSDLLKLDSLELPAEFRLLSTAPPLGTWQYTERPFDLSLKVNWFEPGRMVTQVVEFSEANTRVSRDGELVTDVLYFVKSRGRRTLRVKLPGEPVRLWEVSVAGKPVTARKAGDFTLIPLPGEADPNIPIEVRLRLGKTAVSRYKPRMGLPIVDAPVLKTQWNLVGDDQYVLVPTGGTVTPPVPVSPPTGFRWVAKQAIVPLILIMSFAVVGVLGCARKGITQALGLISLLIASGISLVMATVSYARRSAPNPLEVSLPILPPGESVELLANNTALWLVNFSWFGAFIVLLGVSAIVWSVIERSLNERTLIRSAGVLLIALGILLQGDSAFLFFGLLALVILFCLFVRPASQWSRELVRKYRSSKESSDTVPMEEFGPAASSIIVFALMLGGSHACQAADSDRFCAADSMIQSWDITHKDAQLTASGKVLLSGRPGDQFILLQTPAVLTQFEGEGLRLSKSNSKDHGMTYIVSIPISNDEERSNDDSGDGIAEKHEIFEAKFEYQLDAVKPTDGISVPTGAASVQQINISYDDAGWDVNCSNAVRIESTHFPDKTEASVLLRPGESKLFFKPKARDLSNEETRFFAEVSNLYQPGPGVVDGRHRLHIRAAQGQVNQMKVMVPKGLTVSDVKGPIGAWQYDADTGQLKLELEPPQSRSFDIDVDTQRGLDPLPADVTLAPLRVEGADGQVGLMGIAFGGEAQPEKLESVEMSAVNLGDFDNRLVIDPQAVLHRVFRYASGNPAVSVRVASVDPEVRVVSKQVLSLGDERVVLGVRFVTEISRAGLFQLSFRLPDGLEVESLSGDALHHWSELIDGDTRQIVLHLNGKTIGTQSFSLTLTGTTPSQVEQWRIPRFELNESNRQIGELVVRPTTGIRLRTMTRQNVSEIDPRTMDTKDKLAMNESRATGALAFRLLQRDWELLLGIEKLDPWVTGRVLHEVTIREGQTRSALIADFEVQNASVRTLQVVIPATDEDEIKTLRMSGSTVSDFVRTTEDSNTWEIQLKRRVVGKVQFRIEYERRGDHEHESLMPAEFPQVRQLSYFLVVRAGGRLELEHESLAPGWQPVDWTLVPSNLREAENRAAPTYAFRTMSPEGPLVINTQRHSLADAIKLRVAKGLLTTVLSPRGDQLTAIELTVEVIQRSSLRVGLPKGGELFSIFVNGESVNSVRLAENASIWQFTILPGVDDRTAKVRFVYSVQGDRLSDLKLTSPELNVPLENILWNVVAPKGFELTDSDGNLELVEKSSEQEYSRSSYLSKVSGKRRAQAKQAADLLNQANQFLQEGNQAKAGRALNSVANQYALDAASNEDARVQLENLQTQQAIVGLNTRRQRLYMDNSALDAVSIDNQQLRDAAAANPILQQGELNYRPQQISQLLQGNTTEDNAVLEQLACQLVQHQRTTEPAAQAIIVSLPEEGSVYTFSRSVQVAENAPLTLDLEFDRTLRLHIWQSIMLLGLLIAIALVLVLRTSLLEA